MYTSPREVEITKHADLIHIAYCDAFKARYKTLPFVETEDLTVFSFLAKNFGLDKGREIAQAYVAMNDEWFLKQAHSPHALRKNINKVLADYGLRSARVGIGTLLISTRMACEACNQDFTWSGDPAVLETPQPRLCTKCLEDNCVPNLDLIVPLPAPEPAAPELTSLQRVLASNKAYLERTKNEPQEVQVGTVWMTGEEYEKQLKLEQQEKA